MRRRTPAALFLAVALAVVACSGPGTGDTGGNGAAAIGPFDGASITVEAVNLQFEPAIATMPSGRPLRLVLDNKDAGVPHDIHVFQGDTDYGTSSIVIGPGLTEVRFGPLTAARYSFQCTVHPDMKGEIIVTP
jgi:plastocyanin